MLLNLSAIIKSLHTRTNDVKGEILGILIPSTNKLNVYDIIY